MPNESSSARDEFWEQAAEVIRADYQGDPAAFYDNNLSRTAELLRLKAAVREWVEARDFIGFPTPKICERMNAAAVALRALVID